MILDVVNFKGVEHAQKHLVFKDDVSDGNFLFLKLLYNFT